MKHVYKNSYSTGPDVFITESEPVCHAGAFIYERKDPDTGIPVWDVVIDGVCVAQRAGLNGAKEAAEDFAHGCVN